VSARLDAAAATKTADALVAAMSKTTSLYALGSLSQVLQAVSVHLGAATAVAHAGKAADILVAAMSKTTDRAYLRSLSEGLRAVSGHLDAAAATKAADSLVAAMSKTTLTTAGAAIDSSNAELLSWSAMFETTEPLALISLSEGLRAVSGRLDTARAVAHAGKVADILVAAMSKTSDANALSNLSWGLQAVCERLTTLELVALLERPLATGVAQRALLDVLGHRTRRDFRNTWHFLDWARSNGVDFTLSARTAGPLADARKQ
jgi:hypothetical protein